MSMRSPGAMSVTGRAAWFGLTIALAALLVASVVATGASVASRAVPGAGQLLGEVPDLESAISREPSRPSLVLAADGSVIGRFRPEELYTPITADQLPANVVTALVAAEDQSFWEHAGVDVRGLTRALVENVKQGEIEQGGSTITQQLVKNLFTDGDRTIGRKIDEVKAALQVERHYTKREILAAYLNTAFFGEGAHGVEAASRTYFRESAKDLTLSQAALLVSVIPAPTAFNPRAQPEVAEARRLMVLDRIAEAGLEDQRSIEAAKTEIPVVHERRASIERYPYFLDYVRRWLVGVAGIDVEDLYSAGWTVETTVSPKMQNAAVAAARKHLPAPSDPWVAVVTVDRVTGEVRALVGGSNWQRSQVNLALGELGAGTGRQPGSAFKPFVLALAYESGASPQDVVGAPETVEVGDGHVVHNYSLRGYGEMTLAEATHRSINTTFVEQGLALGLERVAAFARRLGLSSIPQRGVGPTLSIGTYEVSPLRMASAYAAFANDGTYVEPRPVLRILDARGEVVREFGIEHRAVMAPETARLVTSTLRGVIDQGTGRAAAIGRPAAGKTGTTDDYSNAWFVGYTPELSTAVWVGRPEGNVPMRNVRGVSGVTGGSFPARIWRDVMVGALDGVPPADFPPPPARPPRVPPPPEVPPEAVPAKPKPKPKPKPPPPPSSVPTTTTTTALPPTTTTTTTTAPPPTTTTTTTAPPPSTTTTTTAPPPSTTTTTTAPQPSTTTTTRAASS